MTPSQPDARASAEGRNRNLWTTPRLWTTDLTGGDRILGFVPRTAAFFDLDKTIIAKSSTLAFGKPFFQSGLINRRTVLRSAYAQFVFALAGADEDQMDRMRQFITAMCAGWDVAQIREIVSETLHDIIDPIVYDEAVSLIAEHKAAGRDVVIVSTSGEEVVAPIGAMVGADEVVASQMVVEDGKYTGEIAAYRYGPGKAEAIRELAEVRGYDLDDVLRLLRLDHRRADARGGRASDRSEPRSSAAQGRDRTRLAGVDLQQRGAAARADRRAASAAHRHDDRRRRSRPGHGGRRGLVRPSSSRPELTQPFNRITSRVPLAHDPATGLQWGTEGERPGGPAPSEPHRHERLGHPRGDPTSQQVHRHGLASAGPRPSWNKHACVTRSFVSAASRSRDAASLSGRSRRRSCPTVVMTTP